MMRSASLERYYTLRNGAGARPTIIEESRRDRLWLAPIEDDLRGGDGVCRFALDVSGMHCAGCVWVLEELFRREPNGESLLVNPALGRCELQVRPGFDLRHYVESVERLGYLMGPPGKATDASGDALIVRVGVTVALAMNAMMFGIAQYFGLTEEPLRTTVATLEVILSIAAVAVGAPVFFRAAWEGLRRGVLHLDLPIAVGLALSLVGTLVAFARTGDPSFADTLAVFVALMLVGRMIERGALERNRHRLLASEGADGLFARVRENDDRTKVVPASSLRAGHRLVVATGEVVPVDGVACEGSTVSLDWLTGESRPTEIAAGGAVQAGAINVSRRAMEVIASSSFAESGLSDLLRRETPGTADAPARGLFHRVSALWVIAVLIAATATVLVYAVLGDLESGLSNATALLVVTCPCAIGIATPLAAQLAALDLRRAGVVVRRARTLERLPAITCVAFDKTGTLTTGHLRLDANSTRELETLEPRERAILAGLVRNSGHPKSAAVRAALEGSRAASLDVEEHVGAGLRAHAPEGELRLGRPDWAAPLASDLPGDCDLVFSVDGVARAVLVTEEEPREDARAEIEALIARGLRVAILSGDRVERVRRVAVRLGLDRLGMAEADMLGDLSPQQKADWLRERGEACLFVGDGVNDTLAADAAFVSATPSIERPFLPARADFVFTSAGIAPVRWALLEAERLRRIARINLAFAVVYNLVGGTLAALGAFHPWVAAVLMPASSIFVVSRTWLSFGRGVESLGDSRPVGRASSLVPASSLS
ncbi:MAG: cation-translocating P-type ATPase [Deltaproteobacteria bacterium]|nr:cation-translocating P-type ATPase [Deltaproteobacteria bacterium]